MVWPVSLFLFFWHHPCISFRGKRILYSYHDIVWMMPLKPCAFVYILQLAMCYCFTDLCTFFTGEFQTDIQSFRLRQKTFGWWCQIAHAWGACSFPHPARTLQYISWHGIWLCWWHRSVGPKLSIHCQRPGDLQVWLQVCTCILVNSRQGTPCQDMSLWGKPSWKTNGAAKETQSWCS